MTIKPQTVIPPGTVITKGPTRIARGVVLGKMRAVGSRGTESRLPMAKREKLVKAK